MIETDLIVSLISSTGFPIAVSIGVGAYVVWKDQAHAKERIQWRETLEKSTSALNNNTVVMAQMVEVLRKREEEK